MTPKPAMSVTGGWCFGQTQKSESARQWSCHPGVTEPSLSVPAFEVRPRASLPMHSDKLFNFNQLDSFDFILVPYQHSADNVFVEYSSCCRIPG